MQDPDGATPTAADCHLMGCLEVRQAIADLVQRCSQEAWGRDPQGARRLLHRLDDARRSLRQHAAEVRADGSWLQCALHDCPRAAGDIELMCRQHQGLDARLADLADALNGHTGDDPGEMVRIRNAAQRLLRELLDHSLLGAKVVEEAMFEAQRTLKA